VLEWRRDDRRHADILARWHFGTLAQAASTGVDGRLVFQPVRR
jgi:hypothetical protein